MEYIFNLQLGIDQMLFTELPGAIYTSHPNRMAFSIALNLLLLGVAFLLFYNENERNISISQILFSLVGFIALLGILGFIYGVSALYYIPNYTGMAIYAAVSFFFISLAGLFLRSDRGIMVIIASENFGGYMARRLLPAAVLTPIILGWVRILGEKIGLYDVNFGVSLLVLSSVVIFVLIIWWSAFSFNKMDEKRKKAEKAIEDYKNHLEELVDARTNELFHINMVLKAIRDINQLIVQEKDKHVLLDKACQILIQTRGFVLVWIGEIRSGTFDVFPVASAGKSVDYLDSIKVTWDDSPTGQGPTGTAIKTKKPVMQNIVENPKFEPWRSSALSKGFVSSISLPIIVLDEVYGTINIYSDSTSTFDEEEISLLDEMAGDIGLAIHTIQSEQKRKEQENELIQSEKKYSSLYNSMTEGLALHELVFDDLGKVVDYMISDINPSYEKIVGLKKEDVIGKKATALYGTDDAPYLDIYQEVAIMGVSTSFETYFEPMDKYFHISVFSPGKNKFVTVFDDVTFRKRAEEQLKEHTHNLEILNQITTLTNQASNLDDLLEEVLKSIRALMNFENGSIFLVDEATRMAELKLSQGEFIDLAEYQGKVNIDEAPFKTLYVDGKPVILDEYSNSHPNIAKMTGITALAKIPLFSKEAVIGSFSVGSKTDHSFSEDEKSILESIGKELGTAISRIRAEENILNTLKEKELLLREIHHRVNNNLQIISSLLNLQDHYIDDPHTSDVFKESQNRIKSMAMIHEKLYLSQDMANINFSAYMHSIVDYLLLSYKIDLDKIKVHLNLEQVYLNVDTAIPCGLIINELFTNSLKHAFPEGEGDIWVEISMNDDKYNLTIADNGIGLSEDLELRKGKKLGLRLVDLLVNQLDGDLNIIIKDGTKFEFKELKYSKRV